MSFEKEDRQAWLDSEVMLEFEKIATEQGILAGPPPEAFEPVGDEGGEDEWEDEGDEANLMEAVKEFEEPQGGGLEVEEPEEKKETLEEMLGGVYSKRLIGELKKMAGNFATGSKMRVAHRIERCIYELQSLKSGGKR